MCSKSFRGGPGPPGPPPPAYATAHMHYYMSIVTIAFWHYGNSKIMVECYKYFSKKTYIHFMHACMYVCANMHVAGWLAVGHTNKHLVMCTMYGIYDTYEYRSIRVYDRIFFLWFCFLLELHFQLNPLSIHIRLFHMT